MQSFTAVASVLALASSATSTFITTGLTGLPLNTVSYPSYTYANAYAPITTINSGLSRTIYTNGLGYNTLGYKTVGFNNIGYNGLGYNGLGYTYQPLTTYTTGSYGVPIAATIFKK